MLILCSLLMFLNAIFVKEKIEIVNHDTYFVIHRSVFYVCAAIFSTIVWVIYWCAKTALPFKFLTRAHIYSTVIFLLTFLVFDLFGLPDRTTNAKPVTYADLGNIVYSSSEVVLLIAIIIFLMGLISFFLNLTIGIIGLIRKKWL